MIENQALEVVNQKVLDRMESDWTAQIQDLIDSQLYPCTKSEHLLREYKEQILKYYNYSFKHDGTVMASSICEQIMEEQFDICYQIAWLQLTNEYYDPTNYDHLDDEEDIQMAIDEDICELASEWLSEWYLENWDSVEEFIAKIMHEHKMCLVYDTESAPLDFYRGPKDEVLLLSNDCQNMINLEWISEGHRFLEHHTDDYSEFWLISRQRGKKNEQLSIGSGNLLSNGVRQ
jgi:hypothetical protein